MRNYEDIVKLVVEFLNKEKIDYMLVGAISIGIYGVPRTTQDIDIVIQLPEDKIKKCVEYFTAKEFFCSELDIKEGLKEKSHFGIFDKNSPFRIDLKGIYTEFDKQSFQRRVKKEIFGKNTFLCSPEDAIISKLIFGSEKDLNDAEGIILRQREKLDYNYLEDNTKKIGDAES